MVFLEFTADFVFWYSMHSERLLGLGFRVRLWLGHFGFGSGYS